MAFAGVSGSGLDGLQVKSAAVSIPVIGLMFYNSLISRKGNGGHENSLKKGLI